MADVRYMSHAETVEALFSDRRPVGDQVRRVREIQDAGRHLAETILEHTTRSDDQRASIMRTREAVMLAEEAIIRHEPDAVECEAARVRKIVSAISVSGE